MLRELIDMDYFIYIKHRFAFQKSIKGSREGAGFYLGIKTDKKDFN
jgi:hypothetical protein